MVSIGVSDEASEHEGAGFENRLCRGPVLYLQLIWYISVDGTLVGQLAFGNVTKQRKRAEHYSFSLVLVFFRKHLEGKMNVMLLSS